MIVLHRFRNPPTGFAVEAEAVQAFWEQQEGCLGVEVVRNVDDPQLWALVSHWENVGSYRRSFSGYDAKMLLTPFFLHCEDEPSAYLPWRDLQ